MAGLKELQTLVKQIHEGYQNLFNSVVDEYLRISTHWVEIGFTSYMLLPCSEYEKWASEGANFYRMYAELLNSVPCSSPPTLRAAFEIIACSFDTSGLKIPLYNRPNSVPFDLPAFINYLNNNLNTPLRSLYEGPAVSAEEFPIIQFSYTGNNPLVSSLYEKKPRNYHQLTANALVEAHSLLQDWWIKSNKPRQWDAVAEAEIEVFKQSHFCKLLDAHPTLRGLKFETMFELYFSAFQSADEGCTDVQSLINAIKILLIQNTLYSSYANFDDFSEYTGKDKKILQLIKENADAKFTKIKNCYDKSKKDATTSQPVLVSAPAGKAELTNLGQSAVATALAPNPANEPDAKVRDSQNKPSYPLEFKARIAKLRFQHFNMKQEDLKKLFLQNTRMDSRFFENNEKEKGENFDACFASINPQQDCNDKLNELSLILGKDHEYVKEFRTHNENYFQNKLSLADWGVGVKIILKKSEQAIKKDASFFEKHRILRSIVGWIAKMLTVLASKETKQKVQTKFFDETALQRNQARIKNVGKEAEELYNIYPTTNAYLDGILT